MSMQDPIADMFTRVRNAQQRLKPFVMCPKTNYKATILEVLVREGFISGYETVEVDGKPQLKIQLKYQDGRSVIHKISRVSKPSLPVYAAYDDMEPVCNGLGIRIISTSNGLMSDRELRALHADKKTKLGGEVVGEVL